MPTFKQFITEVTITIDLKDITLASKQKGREQLLQAAGLSVQDFVKMSSYFKKATASNLATAYNDFIAAFPAAAKAINATRADGIGPGEMILYFLFDNIGVGGKNSPIDLYLDGKEFAETKGGYLRGGKELIDFKVTKDGDKAVTQLLKDLAKFNDKHEEITGEQLPRWKGAGACTTNSLREWRSIDLKSLAKETKGGSKKSIDLVLKKDGELLRKGETESVLNVNSAKSFAALKKLIGGEATVAVDDAISTIDKIEKRWVEQAFSDYIEGKKFVLLETSGLKLKFAGSLTKAMLGLDYTNRNQPYAVVNLAPHQAKDTEKTEE
jgi:hypothetical protein